MVNYISIAEYRRKVGKSPYTIKNGVLQGRIPEAVKVNGRWMIPAETELKDRRVKSGEYRGWRKKDK